MNENKTSDLSLKRCPFCGHKAELFAVKDNTVFGIHCVCCNAKVVKKTKEEVVQQWNKRMEKQLRESVDGASASELFGSMVRQLREQSGIALTELASLAGITSVMLQRIESGRDVSVSRAEKIASVFSLELYEML